MSWGCVLLLVLGHDQLLLDGIQVGPIFASLRQVLEQESHPISVLAIVLKQMRSTLQKRVGTRK